MVTEATRAEEGCLWIDWLRSGNDPAEYVLVEAFRDGDAGAAHVGSAHLKGAQRTLPSTWLRGHGSSTSRSPARTGPSSGLRVER